ncbi:hypothetical protein QBC38DRAFT_227643 [Podospora fimiseda]|uniref:Uncharacterized protein n=1 Tax=Podospora fimiseda TaxID=252190 RepID=A0AAN7BMV6_9PEZI|nr:hypothetical protein QBC38DRAFT_227643 [Podospora fimiseda]
MLYKTKCVLSLVGGTLITAKHARIENTSLLAPSFPFFHSFLIVRLTCCTPRRRRSSVLPPRIEKHSVPHRHHSQPHLLCLLPTRPDTASQVQPRFQVSQLVGIVLQPPYAPFLTADPSLGCLLMVPFINQVSPHGGRAPLGLIPLCNTDLAIVNICRSSWLKLSTVQCDSQCVTALDALGPRITGMSWQHGMDPLSDHSLTLL